MISHLLMFLFTVWNTNVNAQGDDTVLPFAGTDAIRVVDSFGQQKRLTGRIEDLRGDSVTFRQSGQAKVEFLRVSDVVQFDVAKGPHWNKAIEQSKAGEYNMARRSFDRALDSETRQWAQIEIQADMAKVSILHQRNQEAIDRIAQILDLDHRSRHVSLVPLVWDKSLLRKDGPTMDPANLRHDSEVQKLACASALLHDTKYRDAATLALKHLRRNSRNRRLGDLAEAQLWRLVLLDESGKLQPLAQWHDRVRSIHVDARHGPQFVLGRCLQKQHKHDEAAIAFLWTAFLSLVDDELVIEAWQQAITSLKGSGREMEARRLTAEFIQRHPAAAGRPESNKNP